MPNRARIIVISDTHGRFRPLYEIVLKHMDEASCFIHLGDGMNEIADIHALYPDLALYSVPGNCDFGAQGPFMKSIDVSGKTVLFTHGHYHQVKYGLYDLKQIARSQHANILLYGHTHQSMAEYDDGLYIMNPGSPVQPRDSKAGYGIIDITEAGIVLNLVQI